MLCLQSAYLKDLARYVSFVTESLLELNLRMFIIMYMLNNCLEWDK